MGGTIIRPSTVIAQILAASLATFVLSSPAVGETEPTPTPTTPATSEPSSEPSPTAPTSGPTGEPTAPPVAQPPAPTTTPKVTAAAAEPCPIGPDMTAYTTPPPLLDAWFNTTDIAVRGIWDPRDHRPWTFSQKFANLLCNTATGATVKIGMYFFRATNDSNSSERDRPESDPEVIYNALEWLAKNRGVKVQVLLDNTNTCAQAFEGSSCSHIMTPSARAAVEKRFAKIPGSTVNYCVNGCFNTARYGVYHYAIQHEKFVAVSDTDFPGESAGVHPMVISSSANFARSQLRNYHQEASLIYDDKKAFEEFDLRFDGMYSCAVDNCRLLGDRTTHTIPNTSKPGYVANALRLVQEPDRLIWVDPVLYRDTDAGRGTRVTFSPQRDVPDSDVFIHQFDGVDCKVDKKIRLAMFKLTDGKAQEMANVLRSLKNQGCDIKMLMTSQGGQTVISSGVQKTLNSAGIDYKCTVDAMHTKMILIGPMVGTMGSVLHGTQNMSVAGQLYSEEHVITYDAKRASGAGREAIRNVYGKYQEAWYELSRGASKSRCG